MHGHVEPDKQVLVYVIWAQEPHESLHSFTADQDDHIPFCGQQHVLAVVVLGINIVVVSSFNVVVTATAAVVVGL